VHAILEMIFFYAKNKENVYTTAGPEFCVNLFGKNVIVVKLLYKLKTSAARFHELPEESLLR
jgi:hypothetical protein